MDIDTHARNKKEPVGGIYISTTPITTTNTLTILVGRLYNTLFGHTPLSLSLNGCRMQWQQLLSATVFNAVGWQSSI